MAPNQPPIRFMMATLSPMDDTLGVGRCGSRSAERWCTAMIEFSVVRGIWPSPASRAPVRKAGQEGRMKWGRQSWKEGRLAVPARVKERRSPRRKIRRA
jgi:hypothetical protein